MDKHTLQALSAAATQWQAPEVPKDIPHGDMPGDKVNISEDHIRRCGILFPVLLGKLNDLFSVGQRRAVVSVYGGSGVGTVKLYEKREAQPVLVDEVEASHIGCEYGEYDHEDLY